MGPPSFHTQADSDVTNQGHIREHLRGPGGERRGQRRWMRWVLGITAAFMVAELVGGVLARSLALLADRTWMGRFFFLWRDWAWW